MLAVTDDYANQNPMVVHQFVCHVMRAKTFATGPTADTYISNAARLPLMDEPFGALDAITRLVMQRFLPQSDETPRACQDTRDILSTPPSRRTRDDGSAHHDASRDRF